MSFPRYEAYKDSGVGWLGKTPAHWTVCALSYRYEVQLGKMLDEKRITGEHLGPYLRNTDVQWGRINISDLPEMDFRDDDLFRFSLRPGDLLVCEGGDVGRSAIWNGEIEPCFYQKALHRLRSVQPQKDTAQFLYYALFAAANLGVFAGSEGKATIVHLPAEKLRRYRFAFPPFNEQFVISVFLDRETSKIDALIAEQKRLIDLLKEKRQAVISHAVTKGLDPNAPMKDSGVEWLGEVPAHWTTAQLGHLTTQIVDGAHFTPTYVDEGVPFLRVTDITAKAIDLNEIKRIPLEEHKELIKRCFPSKGDLLLSKNGTVGVPRIVDWDWEFSIFVSLCLIKLEPRLDGHFAEYVFRSKTIESQIKASEKQSTVINLHLEMIKSFSFPLPPIEEQRAVVGYLQARAGQFDDLIYEAESAITLLQERRSALISAAVTGKIDVRSLVSLASEAA